MKDSLSKNTIEIGRAGEAGARRIVLEIPCCWENLSSSNVMFLMQLPRTNFAIPYDVEIDGNTAFVEIQASMTRSGRGKAQLVQLRNDVDLDWVKTHWGQDINVNDIIVNSKMYETFCDKSVNENEPVPEPQTTWLTKILQAGLDAEFIKELWESGTIQKKVVAGSSNVHITRGVDEDSISVDGVAEQVEAGQGINISDLESGKKEISTTQDIDTMAETLEALPDEIDEKISEHNQANAAHPTLKNAVADINGKIMPGTSTSNQLANVEFVNSSISTQTAYFKGTYDVVNDLGLETGASDEDISAALLDVVESPTNNDYCNVMDDYIPPNKKTAEELKKIKRQLIKILGNGLNVGEIKVIKRFKYNSQDEDWKFEYALNNTVFTAQQLGAINSGIDASKVEQIQTNTEDIEDLQDEKLDKDTGTSVYPKLYGKTTTGTQTSIAYTADAYGNSVAARDANGRFRVSAPSVDGDAANKGYIDGKINNSHVLSGEYDDETGGSFTFNFTTKDTVQNDTKNK